MARTKMPGSTNPKENVVDFERLRTINSTLSTIRQAYAQALGYSFQGKRDLYTALGYTKDLNYNKFLAKFLRQDIAKTIVKAPVEETWQGVPDVQETGREAGADKTEFEKKWSELIASKSVRLWHYLYRVDLLSGIGRYAILYLGFDDVRTLDRMVSPISSGSKLLFLTPLAENHSTISTWDQDPMSERFGKPLTYNLNFAEGDAKQVGRAVHWSRVLHVAEGCLESDVFGTPRLEAVFNRLDDLDKVVGGSGEAFWQQGFPGLHFDIRDEADIDDQTLTDLKGGIEDYIHNMTRVLRTQGVDVNSLLSQLADPSNVVSVMFDLLAGATGIPKRILIGSERGELASSQDEVKWAKRLTARRNTHINPNILDPFVARMIMAGILPEIESWEYHWPDLFTPSEKDRADINYKRTESLAKYADSPGAHLVVPEDIYLKNFMEMSPNEIGEIKKVQEEGESVLTAELERAEEDERMAREAEAEEAARQAQEGTD